MPVDSNLPEPRRRRGRRDNGLDAAAYVEVSDVDPRVGEEMLDLLRGVGVAAFLEPKVNFDPYLRATTLPSPPVDRLYVDRDAQEAARSILEHPDLASAHAAAGAPGPAAAEPPRDERGSGHRFELDNSDVDARFADLVAGFTRSDVPDAPPPRAPEQDPAPDADDDPDDPAPVDATDAEPADQPQIWRGPTGALGPAADDPAEHYHPPEPPPWRAPSHQAQLGILVLLAGAAVLFFPNLFGFSTEVAVFFGVAGIAGGVGLLVLRLHKGDRDDDDDGAVV